MKGEWTGWEEAKGRDERRGEDIYKQNQTQKQQKQTNTKTKPKTNKKNLKRIMVRDGMMRGRGSISI